MAPSAELDDGRSGHGGVAKLDAFVDAAHGGARDHSAIETEIGRHFATPPTSCRCRSTRLKLKLLLLPGERRYRRAVRLWRRRHWRAAFIPCMHWKGHGMSLKTNGLVLAMSGLSKGMLMFGAAVIMPAPLLAQAQPRAATPSTRANTPQ